MTSGIYAIKLYNFYYVGSSHNIEVRFKTHFRYLDKDKHLCKKFQIKYNEIKSGEWEMLILEQSDDVSLYHKEQAWVSYLREKHYIILNENLNISNTPTQLVVTSKTYLNEFDRHFLNTAEKDFNN